MTIRSQSDESRQPSERPYVEQRPTQVFTCGLASDLSRMSNAMAAAIEFVEGHHSSVLSRMVVRELRSAIGVSSKFDDPSSWRTSGASVRDLLVEALQRFDTAEDARRAGANAAARRALLAGSQQAPSSEDR